MIKGRSEPIAPLFMELLAERLELYESTVAIEADGAELTYGELWNQAQKIAQVLQKHGVSKGDYVALLMPPSREFFSSVLAVWWIGAAFVPIDPSYPAARRESILRQASCACVLTSGSTVDFAVNSIVIDCNTGAPRKEQTSVPRAHLSSDDTAYLIFTSGSTGEPKGVVVTHRGVTNVLEEQRRRFEVTQGSRVLFYLSVGFDAAISDFGTTFLGGATLVVPLERERAPSVLSDTLCKRCITHIDLPPTVAMRIDPDELPSSLRCIVLGGEVTPAATVRALLSPTRKVFNVYGPTETTICSSIAECPDSWDLPILGAPIPNTIFRVEADSEATNVEHNGDKFGELWIGGIGLAEGFLNNSALTTERFVYVDGMRWYRTGDFVMQQGETLIYHGRQDRQVKVRGGLANLGEVERLCEGHPAVRKAAACIVDGGIVVGVVLASQGAPNGDDECAPSTVCRDSRDYVERQHAPACQESSRSALGEISRLCYQRLPSWMIPRQIFQIDTLPINSNGKVDYKMLAHSIPCQKTEPPSNPSSLGFEEKLILESISRVLQIADVDLRRSFIDIGGDSLSALEVVTALESQHGVFLAQEQLLFAASIQVLLTSRTERGESTEILEGYCEVPRAIRRRLTRQATLRAALKHRSILLTGATGGLGGEVLQQLLSRTDAEIVCLVRARDDAEAAMRLRNRFAGFILDWSRIKVVSGDLEKPLMGFSRRYWRSLAASVDTVWHTAADTSGLQEPERARRRSVSAMREILRFVSWGATKWLRYVSTLSVVTCTSQTPGIIEESDRLIKPCKVLGGYAQGKWICERMLHRLQLPHCSIYRTGLLVDHDPTSMLASFVSIVREEGVSLLPSSATLEIEAISTRGAARLMTRATGAGVFHIVRRKPLSLQSILSYASRGSDNLRQVGGGEFLSAIRLNKRATPILIAAIAAIQAQRVNRPDISLFEISGWKVERRCYKIDRTASLAA